MIRAATSEDRAAIERLVRSAYSKYVGRIGQEPETMTADYRALIRAGDVHVAEGEDGSLLGMIAYYPVGLSMFLETIAVAEAAQGQGLGRLLVARCEESARALGLEDVRLYTNVRMTENLTLYPHLGYAEVERRWEDGFHRVYFAKRL